MSNIVGYILAPLCTLLVGFIVAYIQQQHASSKALKAGVRTLLRKELVEFHELYVIRGAPCPISVKDQARDVYEAYHSLGGNGTATQLYNELMESHIEKEES